MDRLRDYCSKRSMWHLTIILMLLLASQLPKGASGAEWRLVGSRTFEGTSEVHIATLPNLDCVAISATFPTEPARNYVALYDATGEQLWTYRPQTLSNVKVYLEGISEDATTVLALVSPLPPEPTDLYTLARSLVFLDGASGKPTGEWTLEPTDWGVTPSRDGNVLLVRGNNPRLMTRAGTVLCRFNALKPPLPGEIYWQEAIVLLAPDGSYAIVAPHEAAETLFHVTADGDRIWELHLQSGFPSGDYITPPVLSPSGSYLLLGGNFASPAATLEVVPGYDPGLFVRGPTVRARGWSLALVHITRPKLLSNLGGSGVSLLWGESRLAVRAPGSRHGTPPVYRLLDYDVVERKDGITVVAVAPRRIYVYELDTEGKQLRAEEIALDARAQRAEVDVAGDPPVVLVGYSTAHSKTCEVRLFTMRGELLYQWSGEGRVREVYLSTNSRRALVKTPRTIYFFSSEPH